MKRTFSHTNSRMRLAAWLMLTGLFAFLLFSCPVKRALFSSFLPSETVINLATKGNVSSAETLTGGHMLHCCQGVNLAEKPHILQAAYFPVPPPPVIPHRVLKPMQQGVCRVEHKFSSQILCTNTCLFLKNQSFLI